MGNSKFCTSCKETKPISEFNKQKKWKDGLRYYCKKCQTIRSSKQRFEKYKIDQEDYNNLFIKQKGNCAICGTSQKDLKRSLSIDHDHNTDEVRGLLCHKCNVGLGMFNDNIQVLGKAITYLNYY